MSIFILGEAWGEREELLRLPFVGPAGYCLNQMLDEAGIKRSECYVSNVFNLRPKPSNDIENLCAPRTAVHNDLPALRPGKYIRDEYLPELERLRAEIDDANPNVIIAMGNTAAWALLDDPRIGKIRGTTTQGKTGHKVLPTYHPAAILRQWDLRHVTVLDLMKAKRESEFPEVRRPRRYIHIPETISDIEEFYNEHYRDLGPSGAIAADIETAAEQITCIGFSSVPTHSFVIPFVDARRGGSYWSSRSEEVQAWGWVRTILKSDARKVFQNGLYDIHYLWRRYGISVNNAGEDTMLLHHALQPESEKGLGFLGSVYTSEPAWKLMRARGKGTIKKEA